jgi:hypothetical protein
LRGRGLLIAAVLALSAASHAGERGPAPDPLPIYYDGGDCGTERIEL